MLVTIQNITATTFGTGFTINVLDALTGGSGPSGLNATGGAKLYPLPYPFGHIGSLASTATKQLVMHARDLSKGGCVSYAESMSPGEQFNQMIQQGLISFAIAAETTNRDPEEEFIAAVV